MKHQKHKKSLFPIWILTLWRKTQRETLKYLIAGTPAKLHFNKGNLAGYDFELLALTGYNHATKCFKVKQFTDEEGKNSLTTILFSVLK